MFASYINYHYLCTRNSEVGAIAQLVEQRTENPCVPGSIPGGTTKKKRGIATQQRVIPLFSYFPLPRAYALCL